ncbi:hypothetical protein A5780_26465 [Nocardia sp. 852002-20019_SCH5090214]|uniref:hypothetical protein n=1 Tax=Nocardia sp. 852002-20019_SCH5090214 TaxID=1834087 RepID=UPI0007EB3AB7|nr:hypothetical protein [Nocardia sp. 852002-20019_SCH5090214]OBA53587.1 hypothetical protein A5780_26465 [Nocardia sp. 852002-20019_SCH5090214]
MDRDDRSAWFGWLARRELICNASDRVLSWTATASDADTLRTAPLTVHRGMQDPKWRSGGTPAVAAA